MNDSLADIRQHSYMTLSPVVRLASNQKQDITVGFGSTNCEGLQLLASLCR